MKATLVTGAAGFIGSHVSEALLKQGRQVIGLDNLNAYYPRRFKQENLSILRHYRGFSFVHGDFTRSTDLTRVFRRRSIGTVLHLGARAGVRASLAHPRLYVRVNVDGTVALLEAARRAGVRRFLFASSSSVYGASAVPFREDAVLPVPASPYAATKQAAERMVELSGHLYGLSTVIVRLFTVYGPRGRPDMAPYLFTNAILNGDPIRVFGDGSSSRDYTYVDDVVHGILAAVRSTRTGIYNIGNSAPVRLRTLIRTIEQEVGRPARITRLPLQVGDVPRTWADIRRARRELGYQPRVRLTIGIRRFVRWYVRNRR